MTSFIFEINGIGFNLIKIVYRSTKLYERQVYIKKKVRKGMIRIMVIIY